MKRLLLSLVCLALMGTALSAASPPSDTEAEKTIASVSDIIRQAKKPGDLDDLLAKLNKLANPQNPAAYDPQHQIEQQRLQATFRFVTAWQEYLAADASGDEDRRKNSLDNLLRSQQLGDPVFLPRSEILDRMYRTVAVAPESKGDQPDQADIILGAVRKVEDVPDAMKKLNSLANANHKAVDGLDWSQLSNFVNQYDNAAAGLPVVLNLKQFIDGPTFGPDFSRIRKLILMYMLPRALGVEKTDPPKPSETVPDYLLRLRDAAIGKEDWPMVQKVILVQLRLSGIASPPPRPIFAARSLNPFDLPTPHTGSQCFLAGLSREASGEYELAVKSYEDSFLNPDLQLPVKTVAARLAAIKALHPAEYEKGIQDSLFPPLSLRAERATKAGMAPYPSMYPGGQPANYPPDGIVSVLPIPDDLNVPGNPSANPNATGH